MWLDLPVLYGTIRTAAQQLAGDASAATLGGALLVAIPVAARSLNVAMREWGATTRARLDADARTRRTEIRARATTRRAKIEANARVQQAEMEADAKTRQIELDCVARVECARVGRAPPKGRRLAGDRAKAIIHGGLEVHIDRNVKQQADG